MTYSPSSHHHRCIWHSSFRQIPCFINPLSPEAIFRVVLSERHTKLKTHNSKTITRRVKRLASFDRTLFNFFFKYLHCIWTLSCWESADKKRSNFYYDYFSIYDSLFVQSLTPPKGNFLNCSPTENILSQTQ